MTVAPLISSAILLSAILLLALQSSAFLITPLTDYTDFDERCILDYVHHRHVGRRCRDELARYRESFIATVEEQLESAPAEVSKCIVNNLRHYNVSEVLLKAVAYKYEPVSRVAFEESCEGVIKRTTNSSSNSTNSSSSSISTFTDDCGSRATIVILSRDNKSLRNLQHCLNDLFLQFQLDEIVVFDEADGSRSEIGVRGFGRHAVTFVDQLIQVTSRLCGENEEVEALTRLDNATEAHEVSEIFHELCLIDLFGFTGPSRSVERCIIDECRWKFANEAEDDRLKVLTNTALTCLKFF
jgi:hypothetical protein